MFHYSHLPHNAETADELDTTPIGQANSRARHPSGTQSAHDSSNQSCPADAKTVNLLAEIGYFRLQEQPASLTRQALHPIKYAS
jgi:hypothetical protein